MTCRRALLALLSGAQAFLFFSSAVGVECGRAGESAGLSPALRRSALRGLAPSFFGQTGEELVVRGTAFCRPCPSRKPCLCASERTLSALHYRCVLLTRCRWCGCLLPQKPRLFASRRRRKARRDVLSFEVEHVGKLWHMGFYHGLRVVVDERASISSPVSQRGP